MNKYAAIVLAASMILLSACGGGDGSSTACTNTGNMELYADAGMTTLMTGITTSFPQGSNPKEELIYAWYLQPPVVAIKGGYPAGGVDPASRGIHLVDAGVPGNNPYKFQVDFETSLARGTYDAVLRFVAEDATSQPVDCQDVPVTFTLN